MKFFLLLIIFNYCNTIESFAQHQHVNVKKTPFITHLIDSKNQISSITNLNRKELFNVTILKNEFTNKALVKTDSGLYLIFDGTGIIYKAKKASNDSINFTRLDSTFVFGYNNNALNFSYNNIIYSFGGYGIWHNNGQLRYYNSNSSEWFIEKIDQKFNTNDVLYQIATDKSYQISPIIYYITFPTKDEEGFNQEDIDFKVIKYDISTKKNIKLGRLNNTFILRPNKNIDLPSLHGVIINEIKDHYLFNFKENKAYKLTNKTIIGLLENTNLYNTFEEKGKLYYTIYPDTTLHSLSITMADFSKEYIEIYENDTIILKYWWIILMIIIICSILFYTILKVRKGIKKEIVIENNQFFYDKESNEFTEIEKNIIIKIIEGSNSGNYITVDEINHLLGIKSKTFEIQKKNRTESLNRINHKFNVLYKVETEFIERIRSEEDRRFYKYMINQDNSKIYLKNKP